MANTPLGPAGNLADALAALAATIDSRSGDDPAVSYTAKLLAKGPLHCGKKIAEEATELALAIAAEGRKETAEEAGDLLFHMLVGLRAKGVDLNRVAAALTQRRGVSGLTEKATRKR